MSIYTWIVSDKSGPPLTCHTRGLPQNRPMTVGNVLVGKEVQGSAVGPSCKNDHIMVGNDSVGNAFSGPIGWASGLKPTTQWSEMSWSEMAFRVHWGSFCSKTDHPNCIHLVGNELVRISWSFFWVLGYEFGQKCIHLVGFLGFFFTILGRKWANLVGFLEIKFQKNAVFTL